MQLAIDTSTDTASLALAQDSEVLAELTWSCGQNHTTQLLPHLAHLLVQISYLSDTERSFQLKPSGQRYLEILAQLKHLSLDNTHLGA